MSRRAIVVVALIGLSLSCSSVGLGSVPSLAAPVLNQPPSEIQPTGVPSDPVTSIPLRVGRGFRGPWYEVYFTDPSSPASRQLTGGIDGPLVAAIDAARISVHAAIYSLSLGNVRRALIRAHRRGIDVRIVMESDNMDGREPQALKDAGIPMLGDRRQGLMHNKFIVVDAAEVWTGSMNLTVSGVYEDNNSILRINSRPIADDYETEFHEMFEKDIFGPGVGDPTPNPHAVIDGTSIEVYYSPDDRVQAALLGIMGAARSTVDFLAFSFTSNPLGEAAVRAAKTGVAVRGVMDEDQSRTDIGTEFDTFRAAGLDVRLDGNAGQMHDKVFMVDGETVVVGSYNFTRGAEESNDENVLVIHSRRIAALYAEEFQRIFVLARP